MSAPSFTPKVNNATSSVNSHKFRSWTLQRCQLNLSRYSSLEMDMIAPERVLSYCELENEDLNGANKAPFKLTEGAIHFKRVQLRYKPTGELVLKDLSFSIRGGEKIGIVGRTGAGKSSLTMALFRMYPISSGSIWTDGRNVWTVSKQELRRQLSLWSVVSKAGLNNW
ncbi:hypothetical protein Ae201684P_001747 [Aphanomyces euteiches]|nr:hypothetical protein Ae201684P_001747 [Aphanomyces euteiches]